MESRIINKIQHLKSEIEQYRQKTLTILHSNEKINCSNKKFNFIKSKVYPDIKNPVYNSSNSKMLLKNSTDSTHVKSQLLTTNVHVNPNFKPQNPTVHINPKIHKPSIHVNPKIHTKPSIHVNPRMMNNIAHSSKNLQNNANTTNLSITKLNVDNNIIHTNIKRSVYVNPTLLKKLSPSSEGKLVNLKEAVKERYICSRLKLVKKNIDNRKKASNSSIVLLSRRKLVRVTRATKSTSKTSPIVQCKVLKTPELKEKKLEIIPQKTMRIKPLVNNTLQSTSMKFYLSKLNLNKSKVTKYKIDRTTLHIPKNKKVNLSKTRKVINNTEQLITIGGIVYNASKNKLIRRSCSLKRKRLSSGKSDKLNVTINSKKQRVGKETLNRTLETSTINKTRFTLNISPKATYKNSISNKVKQRSIRILRNKMHKNNQPCLIFQRFGSCPNHKNGVCLKLHDKKQVSLCKKFLQGKCLLDKCPLSHDVGPEKMPTCKYFLDGCCTRDACPYLHVKVSSNTSICIDFLQGYCAKGNKCQRRHEYLCPEFDKSGNCSKGECCPYPHKSHSSNSEKSTKYLNKMRVVQKHQTAPAAKDNSEITNSEGRLRYYEITDGLSEDLERKKETVDPKQVQINETNKSSIEKDEHAQTKDCNGTKRKRISISSYIPIDHF